MKWINMTRNDVLIFGPTGEVLLELPRSGRVARVSELELPGAAGDREGVPFVVRKLGAPEVLGDDGERGPLPPYDPEIAYVVSAAVLHAAPRADLYAQDVTPTSAVRRQNGRIIGARRLVRSAAVFAGAPGAPGLLAEVAR